MINPGRVFDGINRQPFRKIVSDAPRSATEVILDRDSERAMDERSVRAFQFLSGGRSTVVGAKNSEGRADNALKVLN